MINWRAYEKGCVYDSSFEKIFMLLLDLELFACVKVHRPFPQHHFKGNLETMLVGCIYSPFKNGLVSTLLVFSLFNGRMCFSEEGLLHL